MIPAGHARNPAGQWPMTGGYFRRCDLINFVKMLWLHIRFQMFVLKMRLLSQQGCKLQSAAMKINTGMHMIIAVCALKRFLQRVLITQTVLHMCQSILVLHKLYIILFTLTPM